MKKFTYSFVAIAIVLFSCTNAEERKLNTMTEIAKAYFVDKAFRENSTIDFFEFIPISYTKVSINYLDTLSLVNLLDRKEHNTALAEHTRALMELRLQQVKKLYGFRLARLG